MPCRPAIVLAVAFGTICLTAGLAWAGDAVFSADGRQIYLIGNVNDPTIETWKEYKPGLREIDLEAKTIRTVIANEEFRGIACSKENKLFCTTANSFSSLDPKTGTLKKIRDANPGAAFWRVAYDQKSQALFVTTDSDQEPLLRFTPPNDWKPVRMRRHPYPSCLVFGRHGELFFAAYGDLWHGEIHEDEGYYSVAAYRYAPLATLETANTTPAEIGVSDIGVAGGLIYVQLERMGGSGDGWFAQLERPRRKRHDYGMEMPTAPQDRLPIYEAALKSLKILGEDFRAGSVCVSPDESRVHYVLNGKHWLVTHGKPEELRLTKK